MATLDSLATQLRYRTGALSSEFTPEQLQDFIKGGVANTDSSLEIADIADGSLAESAAMLHAMVDVALSRASRASRKFDVSGEFGSANLSNIVTNNLKLAAILKSRVEDLEGKMTRGDSDVQVFQLIRTDHAGREVPFNFSIEPEAPVLAIKTSGVGSLELTWTPPRDLTDFMLYKVWRHTSPGLVDISLLSNSEIPDSDGIIPAAILLRNIGSMWKLVFKDTPSVSGTYYYVVEVLTRSARVSHSNEVSGSV